MRFVCLIALLVPALASAGVGSIFAPDPRYIPGTYLPLQAFSGGVASYLSSAGPAFQAINTGTGNSFEAYTPGGSYLFGQSIKGNTTTPILGPLLSRKSVV